MKSLNRCACISLIILVLVTLGLKYAEPLKDGDLWFHLAYARFMVQNHTFVPDHTVFSWTPAGGGEIYCAWISELLLYGLFQLGGMVPLFALKYLALLLFVALVFLFAKKAGAEWSPLAWLTCLLGSLMSPAGVLIKPEVFSFVLMVLAVYLWYSIKLSPQDKWWRCYLFPVLVLVWINSHGGVIFGATFLGALFIGEIMNGLFSREEKLPSGIRKHFFPALLLCGPVTVLTPYGWEYPFQLIQNFVIHRQDKIHDFMNVGAYQSIFHPQASTLHFAGYFLFACVILTALFITRIRNRRPDWTLVLMNIIFGILYVRFIRVTYFWAIIFAFTCIYLVGCTQQRLMISGGRVRKYALAVILVAAVSFAGRSAYESWCKPLFGFWINYVSPVQEAQVIRNHFSGLQLGNDYDSGAYLLWSLFPETKVFIDARYFPYKAWYGEYIDFTAGRNVESFMRKYPCDVWFLTYNFPGLAYFAKSDRWRLVHYGPSGCIFLDAARDVPDGMPETSVFRSCLNVYQALTVLNFALSIGDLETARGIAGRMEQDSHLCGKEKAIVAQVHGLLALALGRRGMTDDAIAHLRKARVGCPDVYEYAVELGKLYALKGGHDEAIEQYLAALSIREDSVEALNNLAIEYSLTGRPDLSLECLLKANSIQPDNSVTLYNISCILAKAGKTEEAVAWLDTAVKKGFDDWGLVKSDPDLENIRDTEFYLMLIRNR